jgi:hypothetical protein
VFDRIFAALAAEAGPPSRLMIDVRHTTPTPLPCGGRQERSSRAKNRTSSSVSRSCAMSATPISDQASNDSLAKLPNRLQDSDRRVARFAQGIAPERERAARLLQGAKQTEALAALAQAARVHAQAVVRCDRLGAELDALETSLRRNGTHLAFDTPP